MKKWTLLKKTKASGNKFTRQLNIDDNIAQIMLNRNISEYEDIEMYINPSFDFLRDPFLLLDMQKAVSRIKLAIEKNEKICIYGDYDVDGVSSTSILKIYFESIGYPVDYYIPNRLEEGYGLNKEAIDCVYNMKTDLMITVDCGITSVSEVDYANKLGIDVIITDHHECQSEIPNAYAVIDPKRKDCEYPFKGLCGCGIALKLINALSGKENFKENINDYLEIVSLATICDIMPVLDENRIIVKNGLEILARGNNVGMKALIKVCGLEGKKIKSSHLGFAIGPRINACGRLGFSNLGVELFTEKDPIKAEKIAELMDLKNQERQEIEARIHKEAEEMISANPSYEEGKVIVLAAENWHHGVIGIVASKLTEKYYKPCILLCIEGKMATGSARSIKGFDLFSALYECRDLMERFGGHEQAAGLTIDIDNIDELRRKINNIADNKLEIKDLIEEIKIEYEIEEENINLDFVDKLHVLEPFGIKNPTPYFLMRECYVKRAYLIGKDKSHLKMTIVKDKEIECIGFSMSYLMDKFDVEDMVDIVFQIDENTYNGKTKVQLLLKDIRLNRPKNILKRPQYLKEIDKLLNLNRAYISSNRQNSSNIEELDMANKEKEKNKKIDTHNEKNDKNNIINTDKINNKISEYFDITGNKICKIANIADILSNDDLIIINSMRGFFRAISDINIASDEKINYIFLSNIDKIDLKVYNKIIMYDYFDNYQEMEYILKNKNNNSEFLINFESSDYIYIRNKFREIDFVRDNFVLAYKFFMVNKKQTMRYSEFIEILGLSPIKVYTILKVLESEDLLNYKIDYDKDLFEFELLPKPNKKLDLEQNKIVKFLNSKIQID
ncbi:MAG: single-stranded-DNA-specific exonuclease RecJ [Peptostreptococcus sp.]|uniref:single-stranded-DNA-specific exonuclease RecJ n=1 Tax=Peptostreptococcus sp. TaxID=1262 RepID=UPI002FCB1F41